MSTEIQNNNGVSITQYAGPTGIEVQVTWKSSDKDHLFDYVSFSNLFDATKFAEILERRLVR